MERWCQSNRKLSMPSRSGVHWERARGSTPLGRTSRLASSAHSSVCATVPAQRTARSKETFQGCCGSVTNRLQVRPHSALMAPNTLTEIFALCTRHTQVDFLKLLANKLTELHMVSASSTHRDRFPRPLFKVRGAEGVTPFNTSDHAPAQLCLQALGACVSR